MTDFIQTPEDMRELAEAELERTLDPDFALASDYSIGALDEQQAAAVRARIETDPAFRELVEPLLMINAVFPRAKPRSAEEIQRNWHQLRRRIGLPPLPGSENAIDDIAARFARNRLARRQRFTQRVAIAAAIYFLLIGIPLAGIWWAFRPTGVPKAIMEQVEARRGITTLLPDGSTAALGAGSKIRFASSFALGRTVKLEGEARFTVVPGAGAFTVQTSNADVWVTGTQFTIAAFDGTTLVTVHEGTVRVRRTDGDGATLTLSAGQRARVAGDSAPERLP